MAPSTRMVSPPSRCARQAPPCTMAWQRTRCCSPAARRRAGRSAAETLTQQAIDELGVGAAAGLLHHVADQRLQRCLLAGAEVGHRLAPLGDGLVDQRAQGAGVADLTEA